MAMGKASQVVSPLRAIARRPALRRHAGSLLAAWAQVALALVVALGSIGLACVATLISVDAAPAPAVHAESAREH